MVKYDKIKGFGGHYVPETTINISIKQHILEFVKMVKQKNTEECTSGHQEAGRAVKEVEAEAFLWCFMCCWE